MTEERVFYKASMPQVRAVRLENFANSDWQGFLSQRLFVRYPAAKIVARQPYVVLVELRTSAAWSQDDETFFSAMKQEGFFQRWEAYSELPPPPRSNRALYEDIGYRIDSGERLTTAQQQALLSQLHNLELRAITAELAAQEQRLRADQAVEHTNRMATTYNALVTMLDQELSLKVYADGESFWMAEDAVSGKILMRGKTLPEIYQTALRLKKGGTGQ